MPLVVFFRSLRRLTSHHPPPRRGEHVRSDPSERALGAAAILCGPS